MPLVSIQHHGHECLQKGKKWASLDGYATVQIIAYGKQSKTVICYDGGWKKHPKRINKASRETHLTPRAAFDRDPWWHLRLLSEKDGWKGQSIETSARVSVKFPRKFLLRASFEMFGLKSSHFAGSTFPSKLDWHHHSTPPPLCLDISSVF